MASGELKLPETLGRYKLRSFLGRGGMGAVMRALDPQLGREVALKVMLWDTASTDPQTQAMIKRFEREVRAQAALHHPNIVSIYDTGMQDGFYFFAMEILAGDTVKDAIKKGGPLPPARVIALGIDVASAIQEMHAHGMLHRDLKPANVFAAADGRFVVMDLGLVKIQDARTLLTQDGQLVGTPMHLAPECIRGKDNDALSDVYQIGTILYEAAAGSPAFPTKIVPDLLRTIVTGQCVPLTAAREGIPPGLAKIVHWAMALDPASRPRTAGQLRDVLVELREGRPLPKGITRAMAKLEDPFPAIAGAGAQGEPARLPDSAPGPGAGRGTARIRNLPASPGSTTRAVPAAGASGAQGPVRAALTGPAGVLAGVLAIGVGAVWLLHAGSHDAPRTAAASGAAVDPSMPPPGDGRQPAPAGTPGASGARASARIASLVRAGEARPVAPAADDPAAAGDTVAAFLKMTQAIDKELTVWANSHDGNNALDFISGKKSFPVPDVGQRLQGALDVLVAFRRRVRPPEGLDALRAMIEMLVDLSRHNRSDAQPVAPIAGAFAAFLDQTARELPATRDWMPSKQGRLMVYDYAHPGSQEQGKAMLTRYAQERLRQVRSGTKDALAVPELVYALGALADVDEGAGQVRANLERYQIMLEVTEGHLAAGDPLSDTRLMAYGRVMQGLFTLGRRDEARAVLVRCDREFPARTNRWVKEMRMELGSR